MYGKEQAEKFRAEVAEKFERSDVVFSDEIKNAATATEFHELLRRKLKLAQKAGNQADSLRLLRHLAANKPYVFQEKDRIEN